MQFRDIYKHLAELYIIILLYILYNCWVLSSYNLTTQFITMKIKREVFQLQNLLVTIPRIGFYHTKVNKDILHLQTARKYNIIALQS